MEPMRRLLSIVGWDGVLPVVVAFAPLLVRWAFRPGHLVEVAVAILLPIVLALVRIHVGSKQLIDSCGDEVGWGRHLALAAAIVLLLLFEMCVMILHFADDEPLSAWFVPIALFAIYLATIYMALRPVACDPATAERSY
jgi:hypothetical protein